MPKGASVTVRLQLETGRRHVAPAPWLFTIESRSRNTNVTADWVLKRLCSTHGDRWQTQVRFRALLVIGKYIDPWTQNASCSRRELGASKPRGTAVLHNSAHTHTRAPRKRNVCHKGMDTKPRATVWNRY